MPDDRPEDLPNSCTPSTAFTRRQVIAAAAVFPVMTRGKAATSVASANFVQSGARTSKLVALTFHGAGDPALTVKALAALRKSSTKVTIFGVGTWIEANTATMKTIVADGHELANHTWSHPSLRRLQRAAVATEITKCADALRGVTGSQGKWFRPSGTPTPTSLMLEEAARSGYQTVVGYDVDPRDYQDPGTKAVVQRTLRSAKGGSIVSLHLGHEGTVAALPGIIDGLSAGGFHLCTVSQILAL